MRAGNVLLEYSGKIKVLKWKDRHDMVTNADLASEKLIIQAVEKEYPDHSILSEEKGKIDKKSNYTWTIDPLDGTKEYVRGVPVYNVAISLTQKDEDILAVVFRPAENQLFSATNERGAFSDGKKIRVSHNNNLADSFIYSYLPHWDGNDKKFEEIWHKLQQLAKNAYRLRATSDLNSCCAWVAMGGCEAFVNLLNPPKPWDIRPGLFIARQAGAKISDLSGNPITDNFENGIIVSNGFIHRKLLEVLNGS